MPETVTDHIPRPRPTATLPGPLTVVELGESLATAVCGRFLGKLGADVTRVLPAGIASQLEDLGPHLGQGETATSAVAAWLRHGKNTIDDAEVGHVQALIRKADVILIAGTSAEWDAVGLSIDSIHAAAPSAVIGHVTTWADSGPYADLRGGELQLQAMGGFMNLIGVIEREPVRLGGYPIQAATGLLVLDGVMIGLFRRQTTGQGARFSSSVFESAVYLEWKIAGFVQAGRRKELRGEEGGGPATVRCRDGFFALFFVPANWEDVKKLIGDPRLDDDRFATFQDRAAHAKELAAIVEETTITRSKKDLYYAAQALNIPAGHVATMTDLLASPQYRARNMFETITVDGIGTGEIPGAPWQIITADEIEGGPA